MSTPPKQRYYSLDVFRGATVAFMILVNNPGSWRDLYSPLRHAEWHGLTPTDLVFPFFLFAVGNAMAFVMPRFEVEGDAYFWKKVVKRTLLIFLIGLFLNWFPFVQWQNNELVFRGWTWYNSEGELRGVRILGVLQRIALSYFFAAVIVYYLKPRGSIWAGAALLLLYWILCIVGNPADPYSLQGWFGNAVDMKFLGDAHTYHGEGVPFEPEGIMSTIPSIVQVIIGYLAGYYILQRSKAVAAASNESRAVNVSLYQTIAVLFVAAALLMFGGYLWGLSFPINKKIWTSSYVLLTSGLGLGLLCVLIYFIEIKNHRGWWSRFFNVFGKNPLFIYALSGLIPKLLSLIRIQNGVDDKGNVQYTTPWGWYYENVTSHFPGPPENGSLLFALSFVFLLWVIAWWMDKKKVYVRV
jgi:predicted acyltransferase